MVAVLWSNNKTVHPRAVDTAATPGEQKESEECDRQIRRSGVIIRDHTAHRLLASSCLHGLLIRHFITTGQCGCDDATMPGTLSILKGPGARLVTFLPATGREDMLPYQYLRQLIII